MATIDHGRVAAMSLTDCQTQTFFRLGNSNKVNMIWHQAVGPDCHVVLPAPFDHQGKIRMIVFIPEERFHSAVTTLGYMVGYTGSNDAGYSWHAMKLPSRLYNVKS